MFLTKSLSISAVETLYAVRLVSVLFVVMLVVLRIGVACVGGMLSIRTVFDLTGAPSPVPLFGYPMTVQFSPRRVSCATIKSVRLLYKARICSLDRDLFQIRTSSIVPLNGLVFPVAVAP